MKHILIYGGSFDPPHLGHINTAIAIQNHFSFDNIIFLPCKQPVLKEATLASCEQRIAMLRLAIESYPLFSIDLREIERDTPSYMVDTLTSFRKDYGQQTSIALLLGLDAFIELPHWHQWNKLLELSHLLVIKRSGVQNVLTKTLQNLLDTHKTLKKQQIFDLPCGLIYEFDAGNYPIASRQLRAQIKAGLSIKDYVPTAVNQYIEQEGLYRNPSL